MGVAIIILSRLGKKKKKNCKVKLLLTKIGKAMQGALTAEITRKH